MTRRLGCPARARGLNLGVVLGVFHEEFAELGVLGVSVAQRSRAFCLCLYTVRIFGVVFCFCFGGYFACVDQGVFELLEIFDEGAVQVI